jgi:hypothetical protein
MSQNSPAPVPNDPPFSPKSGDELMASIKAQELDQTIPRMVVLLDVQRGSFRVTRPQRSRLAARLRSYGAIGELLSVDVEVHPGVFAALDVEESTPKLLLYWKGQLQPPVWLVNPEEPDISGWITALRERGGFPAT